jgi:Subtilase family
MKTIRTVLCLLLFWLLVSCTSPAARPAPGSGATPQPAALISRIPPVASWGMGVKTAPPQYDPNSSDYWQVDLRTADISGVDLRQSLDALMNSNFDSQTKWPASGQMPAGFDYQKIVALGINPGLGVRSLHEQGITGKGVSIAIIDQTLLVDHQEYAFRLRLYEETDDRAIEATMHGAAVASIAVGKTVGVAPEANLYYIASGFCYDGKEVDFSCLAASVRRVLEINRGLPEGQKIRVLSTEIGWGPQSKGYDAITQAAKEAKAAGLLFVSSSVEQTHGFKFHGLGRDPLADPDKFESYVPGAFWAKDFYGGRRFTDRLLVPMDSRAVAGPHGRQDYAFYRMGGWSWATPYIAGMYALAVQVKPSITPDEFWSLALKTGRTIQLKHNGETIPFGPILDPVALIQALKK